MDSLLLEDITGKEWRETFRQAVAAEKQRLKNRLRKAIQNNEYSFVYHFCIGAYPPLKQSYIDLAIYGSSQYLIDHTTIKWVARYYKRLTGRDLI